MTLNKDSKSKGFFYVNFSFVLIFLLIIHLAVLILCRHVNDTKTDVGLVTV